ncbi:carboxyltransferase domain-containing protein, partial [Halomonas marinisediminis]|uniref:carboxyltransferase domain-containing protein n=1 Tax=Halomonas marinisediminis TaxID=2546095 RepID=UPI001F0EFA82
MESDREPLEARLADLRAARDWYAAPFPAGRRLWRIPCVFGGALAPQLGGAAEAAGMSPAQAVERVST